MPHAADSHDLIRLQGARENNLKDVSVDLPKRRLTVFTGVSGSGKSSLIHGSLAGRDDVVVGVKEDGRGVVADVLAGDDRVGPGSATPHRDRNAR